MNVKKEFSLKDYNTFNIDVKANVFVQIKQLSDLLEFYNSEYCSLKPRLILGGGSNILFTSDFKGVIVHSQISELNIIEENDDTVVIKVGSGIVWDDLVGYCVDKGWGGIENLSDIPGNVGAAPVQNIGAYGVEAKDSILLVDAFDLKSKSILNFNNKECRFGYRYSIFKEAQHQDLIITHVTFKLSKNPVLNTQYGKVQEELSKYNEPNIVNLREVIRNIRGSKLPSTQELGSAGSFFKNPVIDSDLYAELLQNFPEIPSYKQDNNKVKIPAAWLIEQAGMKGYRQGDVGTYKNQPLVIVNYGNGTGSDIDRLSTLIKSKVFEKFKIQLEPEVCFV